MNILVVNDDGYFSEGIYILVKALKDKHNVYVVAPDRVNSGVSHFLSLNKSIDYRRVYNFGDIQAYAISGTPSDSVILGLYHFFKDKKIQLVVSGINKGSNLGLDTLYSGTVAAAMEALINKVPAIALSLNIDNKDKLYYDTAAEFLVRFLDTEFINTLDYMYNINVPNLPFKKIKGFKYAILSKLSTHDKVVKSNECGKLYIEGNIIPDYTEKTDFLGVYEGYITISKIKPHFCDFI